MSTMLILAALLTAPPEGEELKLLQTFRNEFVHITPGEGKFPAQFTMGSDEGPAAARPARQVTLKHNFHIAKYEVPQNLWQAVMGNNPSRWKGDRNSVEKLSHEEAADFCRKVTKLLQAAELITDKEIVRLPSEVEWEYAARAGTKTKFSFGDDLDKLDAHAWHTGNAAGNDPAVGELKPNPWGLYDMHGYLWEWCADPWHANYERAPEGASVWSQDGKAKTFVVRGGSWKDKADRCTSRFRLGIPAGTRDDAVGLRCVLAQPE